MNPIFFASPRELRAWLEEHHADERELWVGFRKRGSGLPSLTWPEAVDEALCFGWIDGVRRSVDETSYANRFTPRTATSHWSEVNRRRMEELTREGRVHPAGLAAYGRRSKAPPGPSSYEQRHSARLDEASERRFRERPEAWSYFERQGAGYRQLCIWWVVSAKLEETRQRRLGVLIEESSRGRPVPALRRPEPVRSKNGS